MTTAFSISQALYDIMVGVGETSFPLLTPAQRIAVRLGTIPPDVVQFLAQNIRIGIARNLARNQTTNSVLPSRT